MIQGSKGYWLTTPILAIQVFTDHMQVRELLHLMGVEQAECNMASVHKKIYIAQLHNELCVITRMESSEVVPKLIIN